MTTLASPVVHDQRARWRAEVGLDCPARPESAGPAEMRYAARAEASWRTTADVSAARG